VASLSSNIRRGWVLVSLAVVVLGCQKPEDTQPDTKEQMSAADTTESRSGESIAPSGDNLSEKSLRPSAEPPNANGKTTAQVALAPLPIVLPAPAFRGTPKPLEEPNVEEPLGKPRPPFLAPEGVVNLALDRRVSSSDPKPSAGELDYVTDGRKEASDFGYLELRPGAEWVQIDLGATSTVYAVLVWHNHADARVYRDVVVQVSDDPDFLTSQTVFNNDFDNSSGLGIGFDMGYVETSEGKLIDCKGVEARYIRLFTNGNHMDDKNHYTEVEVFGGPTA
jgi:hypothetical protein